MTDGLAHLDDSQSWALFDIETRYYREARKCQEAGAYLAGCVMLGAALEANLIAMVDFHLNEVSACKKAPRRSKGSVKKLLNWQLGELLGVASELGWLPASEPLGNDPKDWLVGDHAQVVRILRNLIHPGRYVKEYAGFQFTAETLTASFNSLDGVYLHLHAALSKKMEEPQEQA